MTEQKVSLLFVQLALMLLVALAGGAIMQRLGQPKIIGEILGGVVLGPTVLGAVFPQVYLTLFPDGGPTAAGRGALLTLGMLFFLFIVGLEVKAERLGEYRSVVIWTSITCIVVPFVLGAGSVVMFPHLWGIDLGEGPALPVLIGVALSISALPVIARILRDNRLLDSDVGAITMGVATINDIVGWSLFTLLIELADEQDSAVSYTSALLRVSILGALFLIWLLFRKRLARGMETLTSRFTSGSTLVILVVFLIGASGTGQAVGIHAFLIAFLLGLAFRDSTRLSNYSAEGAHNALRGVVTGILAPLYFVSIGLQANFIAGFDPALVLLVFVVACAGKLLGTGLGAWLGKLAFQKALYVGVSLNSRGAIEIVLASVALQHGLIDERIFVALVLMALLTSLRSGLVIPWLARSPATALLDPRLET